jgi:hypothetical protein
MCRRWTGVDIVSVSLVEGVPKTTKANVQTVSGEQATPRVVSLPLSHTTHLMVKPTAKTQGVELTHTQAPCPKYHLVLPQDTQSAAEPEVTCCWVNSARASRLREPLAHCAMTQFESGTSLRDRSCLVLTRRVGRYFLCGMPNCSFSTTHPRSIFSLFLTYSVYTLK